MRDRHCINHMTDTNMSFFSFSDDGIRRLADELSDWQNTNEGDYSFWIRIPRNYACTFICVPSRCIGSGASCRSGKERISAVM
jgi:hypothetical protein